jgi:uncharacterized protein YndB with AHSA1/START domain
MVEQQSSDLAVRRSIVVDAPPERAFAVFTEGMTSWWPMQSHSIAPGPMAAAVIEPHAGGRWFERSEDGSECDWGRVVAWEPPDRVVLTWQISPEWQYDAGLHTEIEVRFTAEDERRTRVDLEHRNLEAYAERAEQMRTILGSDGGWDSLLGSFAEAATGGA